MSVESAWDEEVMADMSTLLADAHAEIERLKEQNAALRRLLHDRNPARGIGSGW